jgi:hypothetical protein
MKAALTWMIGFPKMGAMIEIKSSSLSLRFRIKNKSLRFSSDYVADHDQHASCSASSITTATEG